MHDDRTGIVAEEKPTVGVLARWPRALSDLAIFLEVDVPRRRLALLVLEREGEDGIAALDGGLALGHVAAERRPDQVKGDRGREGI